MTILQTYPICIVSNMIVVDFFMFEWMSQQLICVGDLDCFFFFKDRHLDGWIFQRSDVRYKQMYIVHTIPQLVTLYHFSKLQNVRTKI
jgi:hypothetical protein